MSTFITFDAASLCRLLAFLDRDMWMFDPETRSHSPTITMAEIQQEVLHRVPVKCAPASSTVTLHCSSTSLMINFNCTDGCDNLSTTSVVKIPIPLSPSSMSRFHILSDFIMLRKYKYTGNNHLRPLADTRFICITLHAHNLTASRVTP